MIVDPIAALAEQEIFIKYYHDELVDLHAIIYDMVLIFYFDRESMFVMHLSSNHTVTNKGRVASALMILVTKDAIVRISSGWP